MSRQAAWKCPIQQLKFSNASGDDVTTPTLELLAQRCPEVARHPESLVARPCSPLRPPECGACYAGAPALCDDGPFPSVTWRRRADGAQLRRPFFGQASFEASFELVILTDSMQWLCARRVPFDPSITRACETGASYVEFARRSGKLNLLKVSRTSKVDLCLNE